MFLTDGCFNPSFMILSMTSWVNNGVSNNSAKAFLSFASEEAKIAASEIF